MGYAPRILIQEPVTMKVAVMLILSRPLYPCAPGKFFSKPLIFQRVGKSPGFLGTLTHLRPQISSDSGPSIRTHCLNFISHKNHDAEFGYFTGFHKKCHYLELFVIL